jgi:hypothetical protein
MTYQGPLTGALVYNNNYLKKYNTLYHIVSELMEPF